MKESNPEYTECPNYWEKLFKCSNTEQVANLANEIQKQTEYNTRRGLRSLSHIGKGLTPIHLATKYSQFFDLKTIKNILELESEKNPKDIEGNTPLHLAARKGNLEVFLLIKEKVEDINPKNGHDNTPLHRAALSHEICAKQIVEMIIQNVVEKNPKNVIGITPLHNAALNGRLDIFQLLFDNVTNKNPIDDKGETPLHKAADATFGGFKYCQFYPSNRKCQHTEICQLILDNIDQKNPVNSDGKTPLEMALQSNHSLVVNFLTNN